MRAMRWFSLDDVFPNTYQPRTSEDPEHVRKLADSIMRDGLLQMPVGRLDVSVAGGRVELAFGHSRLAAYKLLAETSNLYKKIPVEIRELDDTQMFEMAITENVTRKNLTPIEEAQAMRRYRDDFGKTSVEIGKLFGISDSAVRNKLRLLDLPEAAQETLKAGQIGESSARRLLTLQRVRPDHVEAVIQKAVEKELSPKEVDAEVSYKLEKDKSVKTMWYSWKDDEPRGGPGLWTLTWKPDKSGKVCTSCEFYVRMNDNHYCCDIPCWKQKKNEWMNAELIRLRDEMGITVYNSKEDGKTFVEHRSWDNGKLFKKWIEAQSPDLRLRIAYTDYSSHAFTESYCVALVSVDPAEVAKIEKQKSRKEESTEDMHARYEKQQRLRKQSDLFIWHVASVQFASEMGSPSNGPLKMMTEMEIAMMHADTKIPEDPREMRDVYRRCLAEKVIRHRLVTWEKREQGPVAVAAELRSYAVRWGVWLPEDWDAIAQRYENGEDPKEEDGEE